MDLSISHALSAVPDCCQQALTSASGVSHQEEWLTQPLLSHTTCKDEIHIYLENRQVHTVFSFRFSSSAFPNADVKDKAFIFCVQHYQVS